MTDALATLAIVSTLAYLPAHGEACAHRVIFLPQTHSPDGIPSADLTPSGKKEIAASQLQILDYLNRFPQMQVLSEQVTVEDVSSADIPAESAPKVKTIMNDLFPQGFGIDANSLNEKQVEKLVELGAETIQLMRGKLDRVHRVLEDQATDDEIFGPVLEWFKVHPNGEPYPPEIARLIYGAREAEALRQVKKFFAANRGVRDVALMFGRNHNFSFYPDLFPPACVVVPPEFAADWTGKYRVGPEGFSPEVMKSGVLPTTPQSAR